MQQIRIQKQRKRRQRDTSCDTDQPTQAISDTTSASELLSRIDALVAEG